MKTLADKVALITGGASGIGRATALLFAQEGAAVAIMDIQSERGEAVVREIESAGGRAIFIPCDVTRAEDCRLAVEKTVATFGGLSDTYADWGDKETGWQDG